ncbi:hypothetical protein SOVF_187360 [Spinacia oleracea]|nr:hypothetical protein SOVF_187360 [Spinacia oleracea]
MAAIFLMGIFCFALRYCTDDTSTDGIVGTRRGSVRRSYRATRGLDLAIIDSFPIFDYAAIKLEKIGKGALECAVCLMEFEDNDTLRLIPKCDHVFHPDCIDPWLVGHTTCPLCRCNLTEAAVIEEKPTVNDVVVEVRVDEVRDDNNENGSEGNETMEQPLHGEMNRSRTIRNLSFGRPRWLGKIGRSFSTGHVAVKQWENMERFTLRLPEELRKQIMSGKLEKTTSLVGLPRGSYPSRGQFESGRADRSNRRGWSDWWGLSLASPFFTRNPSLKSPNVAATKPARSRGRSASSLCGPSQENVSTSREVSLRGAMQTELTQLPV